MRPINKKSQILVVIIWVLLILTVLAIGIAHRVSFALRLSSMHNHSLKALYLSKAGVNLAITEIKQSTNTTTSFNDAPVNNSALFEKIYIGDKKEGENYSSVYYEVKENSEVKKTYGVLDQESLININKASKEVLLALFAEVGISDANEIVNNIRFWRGDTDPDLEKTDYTDLGYVNKGLPFINKQELMMVKGIDEKNYEKLFNYICVNDDSEFKVNINTASKPVLRIIFGAVGANKTVFSDILLNYRVGDDKVWGTRDDKIITNSDEYINNLAGLGVPERDLLKKFFTVKSDYFEIKSVGQYGRIKKSIIVVYNRQNDKIIYYHES